MNPIRLITILAIVAILLLIPFIAMQLTNEVNWTGFDFLIMGTLLFITGLLLDFAIRKVATRKNRIIASIAIVGAFLLIWVELAVGIF